MIQGKGKQMAKETTKEPRSLGKSGRILTSMRRGRGTDSGLGSHRQYQHLSRRYNCLCFRSFHLKSDTLKTLNGKQLLCEKGREHSSVGFLYSSLSTSGRKKWGDSLASPLMACSA